MSRLVVIPMNEPDGEGNGWVDCAEADATSWHVLEQDNEGDVTLIEAFDNRAAAIKFCEE